MPNHPTVDEVVDAIKKMSPRQRRHLTSKLAEDEALTEEIGDIIALIRTDKEPGEPFDEFVEELKAEGYDIPNRH